MNAVDHCALLGDALDGCIVASDKLEGLAFAGDRLAQRGIINAFRWLWEQGRLGDLEFTSRCIPFARVAAEHDRAALNELAGLLHVRGAALRELKDVELTAQADDLQAEALSILNWLADHGDESAGDAVQQFVADVPSGVAERAATYPPPIFPADPEMAAIWTREAEQGAAAYISKAHGLAYQPVLDVLSVRLCEEWPLLETLDGWHALGALVVRDLTGTATDAAPPTLH